MPREDWGEPPLKRPAAVLERPAPSEVVSGAAPPRMVEGPRDAGACDLVVSVRAGEGARAPFQGCAVTLDPPGWTTRADSLGLARFISLPPGDYTVRAIPGTWGRWLPQTQRITLRPATLDTLELGIALDPGWRRHVIIDPR